jgi:Fur family iron response transcriptional regulator
MHSTDDRRANAERGPAATTIEQRLREAGIKPTRQRLVIAQVMLSQPQHLSADQLQEAVVRAGHEGVSKATIYNTLGLFSQMGLVREVIVDPNRVFYDSNVADHHHLYHVDSGALVDIRPDQVEVRCQLALSQQWDIDGIDVIIRVRTRA